jgi:hypothetical protein
MENRMHCHMKNVLLASALFAMALATSAAAQDFLVRGTSSTILHSQNIDSSAIDKIAVRGVSTPQPHWGIGGQFDGGYNGVRGFATLSGVGTRIGGYFAAQSGSTNYGIMATASGGSGSTSWAGYFTGNVYVSGTLTQASDARLKRDIADLTGALPQLMTLRPRTYRYRTSDFPAMNLAEGKQVGLIAQEVAPVFPELVHEVVAPSEKGKDPGEKTLSVDYVKLVPVLIRAVQEQQAEIEALQATVKLLKKN